MKLFIRDHILLVLLNLAQISITVFIYTYDNSKPLEKAIYVMVINLFLLVIYLSFRYGLLFFFYQQLTKPIQTLDQSFPNKAVSPLGNALYLTLYTQYQYYQKQLHQYEQKIHNHITFINQWIHQMKTPLAVIDLTIQEEDDPIFDSIRDELGRLKRGLETVLFTSRLDLFKQDFHVEPISLSNLIKQVLTDHRHLLIRNHIYPETYIDKSFVIQSDKKWLPFIIGQLITNAVRYTTGQKKRQLVISAFIRGKKIGLEITDNGIGIPTQDQRRVFEPYFTGENGRKYAESTGMGLYLVHEVCRALNHEVELESKVNQGTSIRIIFQENIGPFLRKINLHRCKIDVS